MIGGNRSGQPQAWRGNLNRERNVDRNREADNDDLWAAGVSLVLCAFTLAAVCAIMWLSL